MSHHKQLRRHRRTGRGFTLVEIMIVVLIMGVLLNMAAPGFIHARDSGQSKSCVSNLHNLNMAKEQWALQTAAAPTQVPTWANLQPYIHSNLIPVCPTTGQSYAPNGPFIGWGAVNQMPLCPYGGPAGEPTLAHTF